MALVLRNQLGRVLLDGTAVSVPRQISQPPLAFLTRKIRAVRVQLTVQLEASVQLEATVQRVAPCRSRALQANTAVMKACRLLAETALKDTSALVQQPLRRQRTVLLATNVLLGVTVQNKVAVTSYVPTVPFLLGWLMSASHALPDVTALVLVWARQRESVMLVTSATLDRRLPHLRLACAQLATNAQATQLPQQAATMANTSQLLVNLSACSAQ